MSDTADNFETMTPTAVVSVKDETTIMSSNTVDIVDVTVHPLVLLSAADHYHRVARGTKKRVVGVLLGSVSRGKIDATNSFAVPFEEDSSNPVSIFVASILRSSIFTMDHNSSTDFTGCVLLGSQLS